MKTINEADIKITIGGETIVPKPGIPMTVGGMQADDSTGTVTVTFDPERSDLAQLLAKLEPLPTASRAAVFKQMMELGLSGKRARFIRRAMGLTPRLGPVRGRRSRQSRGGRARNALRLEHRKAHAQGRYASTKEQRVNAGVTVKVATEVVL